MFTFRNPYLEAELLDLETMDEIEAFQKLEEIEEILASICPSKKETEIELLEPMEGEQFPTETTEELTKEIEALLDHYIALSKKGNEHDTK